MRLAIFLIIIFSLSACVTAEMEANQKIAVDQYCADRYERDMSKMRVLRNKIQIDGLSEPTETMKEMNAKPNSQEKSALGYLLKAIQDCRIEHDKVLGSPSAPVLRYRAKNFALLNQLKSGSLSYGDFNGRISTERQLLISAMEKLRQEEEEDREAKRAASQAMAKWNRDIAKQNLERSKEFNKSLENDQPMNTHCQFVSNMMYCNRF